MSTGVLILVVAAVSALILAGAVLVSRGGGGKRPCGSCGRAMLPAWTQCMFCGWSAPVATSARLEIVAGPLVGQVVSLNAEITTFGSVAGNTVVLPDSAVSKKHAGIRLVAGRVELADLGSTNGVYVNGARVPKKLLEDGDVVSIGHTEIVFRR